MNKRILTILLAMALLLGGCQLAQPEAQKSEAQDMLVGVFLTTEPLGAVNTDAQMEAYLSGKDVSAAMPETDRIYGVFEEEIQDGMTTGTYSFPDLDGILLASFRIAPHGENTNAYWSTALTEGICDVKIGHHSKDNGETLTLSGTVYTRRNNPEHLVLYHNPVYQTQGGEVYVIQGDGVSFGDASCSQTLKAAVVHKENGKEATWTAEIDVHVEPIAPAESVEILQMDREHKILHQPEYELAQLPEMVLVPEPAEYLLLEEHLTDGSIRRTLYQNGDGYVTIYESWEKGICIKRQIPIQWNS